MFENLQFVIFKEEWTYRLSTENTSQGFLWWADWGSYHNFLPLHQGLVPLKKFSENNKENNSLSNPPLGNLQGKTLPVFLSLIIQSRHNNSI